MKRCQDTFCHKIANPGFIYCTDHLHKAMTENKNQWETVKLAGCLNDMFESIKELSGLSLHEYRLQRRKKEIKVWPMPQLKIGDAVTWDDINFNVVITGIDGMYFCGGNASGERFEEPISKIKALWRDANPIWRREG